jgi:hypothetical protein
VFCDLETSSGVVSIRIGPDTKFSRDTIADAESNDTTSKLFSTSMILSIFCYTCIFIADQIVPAAGGGEHKSGLGQSLPYASRCTRSIIL